MIKLNDSDKTQALEYVKSEPEVNLFIIGDIENFGFEDEAVDVYISAKETAIDKTDDEIKEDITLWDGIVLRYYKSFIVYSQNEDYNPEPFAEYIKDKKANCISGKRSIIEKLAKYFDDDKKCQHTFLSRCNMISEAVKSCEDKMSICENKVEIRRLTKADSKAMYDLYLTIEEFAETYNDGDEAEHIEQFERNMDTGGVAVGVFENDYLVAVGETSGANSLGSMIVGVATRDGYRKRGFATAVVKKICEETFNEGKQFICLFYDNPEAGAIYRKIGFEEIGEYTMFR